MSDLANFQLSDMAECSASLRRLGEGAGSLSEVAERTVRFLYERLTRNTGAPSCALIRFFKTHPHGDLDPKLQEFARGMLGDLAESPAMPCLTLLATAGEKPEWNCRDDSRGHQAIPLASERFVEQFPMISQLIRQFGVELSTVLEPDPNLLVDLEQKAFNVFHIPDALGTPYVPAQDFVESYGVKSVLGFGGMLPKAHLFAIILFSKVPISRDTAEMFNALGLSIKVALLPFVNRPLFPPDPS